MVQVLNSEGDYVLSIQDIVKTLENLMLIHEELYKVSKEKTDLIIEGSAEELQHLLVKERKYIQLLEQFEKKREKEVENWFDSQQITAEDMTLTNMLEKITNEVEKKRLENITVQLTNIIIELKQQEQLNEDLIRQSMQFVHMSLEMLHPTIEQMNYGNQKKNKNITNRSVFDSQA